MDKAKKMLTSLGLAQAGLEIRFTGNNRPTRQLWLEDFDSLDDILDDSVSLNRKGYNVFFGAALRNGKKGDQKHVKKIPALWCDVDGKDFPNGETGAREKIESLPRTFQPSFTVNSGHGFHAYWLLKKPLKNSDIKSAEPVLRGIVEKVNGDKSAAEIARVMRLPGTLNLKKQPFQECRILTLNPDRKYDFERLSAFFKPTEKTRRTAKPIDEKITEGSRNSTLTSLAGSMRRRGMNEAGILAALKEQNSQCDPPLPDTEVENIAKSVARYAPAAIEDTEKPEAPIEFKRFTDLENSRRFLQEHGNDLLFCPERKRWLLWTKTRWQFDEHKAILKKAKQTVSKWRKAITKIKDPDEFKAAATAVARCESHKKLSDMLTLAACEVTKTLNELDQDPDLFQAGDRTVDLKNGEVCAANRENLITKSGCVYQENASCPRFMQFLDEVFESNQELIGYLQRVLGYGLLGGNPERIFLLFHGSGWNGKSTFVETLLHVFGDYACSTPTSTLMVQRGDSIPNDVARLKGSRLITAQESTEGRKLHAEKIKQMTGNDTISARFMRGEWFDFKPEFLLIFSSNFKPRVDAADDAVWDRLKLIPFNRRFSEAEKETGLQERLKAEGPGILRWLIEGHKLWRTDGLKEPECVKQVRSAFRQEMDRLQEFLAECTEKTPGDMVSKAAFHSAFNAWLKENGSRENFSKKKITSRLLDLGFNDEKTREGRFWCDIKLNSL